MSGYLSSGGVRSAPALKRVAIGYAAVIDKVSVRR
jgi:hypothetical protein